MQMGGWDANGMGDRVRERETDGAGLMVFAAAGTKTPGRARGEDRENCAELLMSSAPCSLCSGR